MDMDNEELKKDLEEQYAMLETEIEEDKKKKRYLVIFIITISRIIIIRITWCITFWISTWLNIAFWISIWLSIARII